MERIRKLNKLQKLILIAITVITAVFTAAYIIVINTEGFLFRNKIMTVRQEADSTVYSKSFDGQMAQFKVYRDGTITYSYMDELFGPYTVMEDQSAVPPYSDMGPMLKGVEIYYDSARIFRGAYVRLLDGKETNYWIYNENGSPYSENQDQEHLMVPAVSDIIRLYDGPVITHKGEPMMYFLGLVLCIVAAGNMLFADELFRRSLSFRIKHPYDAEPSEWEMTSRYIAWILLPAIAVLYFIEGLK